MGGVANALMVRWSGGTTWEEDAPSIAANGRREQVLKLPGITSAPQAREVARAVLDLRANARTRTTAGHLPAGTDEPFTAYNLGDLVTAPGPDGSPVDLRVQSITVNERDDGELEFSPELGSRVDELEDALARFLAKFGTAPSTENGSSSGGDASPYDPGPDYDPLPPTEPDPVPPTEPWEDPTINGGAANGQQSNDPNLNGTVTVGGPCPDCPPGEDCNDDCNPITHVIVPPPEEGGTTTTVDIGVRDDDHQGAGAVEVNVGEAATWTAQKGSQTNLNGETGIGGNVEIGDGIVFTKGASPENLTLGTMWDKVRGIWGKLTGGRPGAETTIDASGNMVFGQDGVNRPTIDFTNADVLGLGGGGGCINTTTASDSGVFVDCTASSPAANIVQFGRSGDVSTSGIPTKGGYLLGSGLAGGGAFELGANNSATGKFCYVAGQAGSGYLDIYAEDFIQLFSNTSVIVFSQEHPSSSQFAWYFDFDGTDWYIVDQSNMANRWKISP